MGESPLLVWYLVHTWYTCSTRIRFFVISHGLVAFIFLFYFCSCHPRRMAAWVVAIGAVAAYNYYDSQKTGEFTKEEQDAWNKKRKEAASK